MLASSLFLFLSFHLISSAEKLTMVGMKFSLMVMDRICFQSVVLSPRSKQMDSRASFTAAGGLAMERTSTRCCFLMDLTAINISDPLNKMAKLQKKRNIEALLSLDNKD
uniref:Secreted protein n=1 Tax=Scophthalmus maximus TaxID=52904 RepID=A0A8D3BBX9_SCOMX